MDWLDIAQEEGNVNLLRPKDQSLVDTVIHHLLITGITDTEEEIKNPTENTSVLWHDTFEHLLALSLFSKTASLNRLTRGLAFLYSQNHSFAEYFALGMRASLWKAQSFDNFPTLIHRTILEKFAFYIDPNSIQDLIQFRKHPQLMWKYRDHNFYEDICNNLADISVGIASSYENLANYLLHNTSIHEVVRSPNRLDAFALLKNVQRICVSVEESYSNGDSLLLSKQKQEIIPILHAISTNDLIKCGVYSDAIYGYVINSK